MVWTRLTIILRNHGLECGTDKNPSKMEEVVVDIHEGSSNKQLYESTWGGVWLEKGFHLRFLRVY